MTDIIQLENKFYISVNSTYADDRVKVLTHINTFGIFDRWGDIKQVGEEVQGIYYNGMRFISDMELRINDVRPLMLSSSIKEENEILSVDLTNPYLSAINGKTAIPKDVLHLGRSKFIQDGNCFEQIRITNYGNEAYEFSLSLSVNADFKDIFEVRGMKREKRGEVYEIKHMPDNKIIIYYLGLDDIKRRTEICFSLKADNWDQHNKAVYHFKLQPHQTAELDCSMHFIIADEKREYRNYASARVQAEQEIKKLGALVANITTSNQQFTQWISRSKYDLLSLLSSTGYGYYPYAGVPWYNTPFGRDGIITALEVLWVAPQIGKDVLLFLAQTQATEENAYQDAEPGKIIHEMRTGEMVNLNEVPFKRYYGSIDATPLFIVLAGAYYKRTADIETIKAIWPNIKAAVNWIEEYGDQDGDGFIEYHHKSVNGLINQGWKDSHDSISDEHGVLVMPPVALCEVQGYVYDAFKQAATLAAALDDVAMAITLNERAIQLKQNFNEKFWDEELSCYVIALQGDKKPCRIISSNAGHCLFSGIADEDKAKKVVQRLMQEDMFSGWGIRTLSTNEKRYNPMSYHNGSIWPHDVAIIAKGFARYGFQTEMLQLVQGLFDASLFIEMQRLPELFCGFTKRGGEGPTEYPVACSPQAWSVASVFMLLQACLNIEINALEKKVYLHHSILPDSLASIQIENLQLGNMNIVLDVFCENNTVGIKVKSSPPGWQILLAT